MKEFELLKKFVDNEGQLSVLEGSEKIPFSIDRIFFVYGTASLNKEKYDSGKIEIINISSSCVINTINDKVRLENHNALFLDKGEFINIENIDNNSKLLVLVSKDFDINRFKKEYILKELINKDCNSNHFIEYDIKRLYYISDVPKNIRRGYHAHKKLKQYLTCFGGECTVLIDDGKETNNYILDNPEKGIYVYPCKWREMYNFSKEAVLLAVVSELYDENDYIRDYNSFRKYIGK